MLTPEVIVAGIAFLGAVLGGGHLVNAIASRQKTRSEARSKAAEGEVAQSKEAREWADDYRAENAGYRRELDWLRRHADRDRTLVLTCEGGVPCPRRSLFIDNVFAPPPDTPDPPAGEGGASKT